MHLSARGRLDFLAQTEYLDGHFCLVFSDQSRVARSILDTWKLDAARLSFHRNCRLGRDSVSAALSSSLSIGVSTARNMMRRESWRILPRRCTARSIWNTSTVTCSASSKRQCSLHTSRSGSVPGSARRRQRISKSSLSCNRQASSENVQSP